MNNRLHAPILLSGYVVVLHLAAILNMLDLLPSGKPAYVVDLATLVPMALALSYWLIAQRHHNLSPLDLAVALYFVISLVSGLSYVSRDNPSSPEAFVYGIHYFVMPMFLYYAVKRTLNHDQHRLLSLILALNVFSILSGLILFYLRPGFYHAYLVHKVFSAAEVPMEEWQLFGRLQSYWGSTAVGTIASTSIVLLALLRVPLMIVLVTAPVILLGALLTYQRGGMFASLIAMMYLAGTVPKSLKAKVALPVAIAVCMLLAVSIYTGIDSSYLDRLKHKYSWDSVLEMMNWGDRGYGPGLAYIRDFPLGVGLGGTSSGAQGAGLASRGQVVDANFMRILSDLGLMGLWSFVAILFLAARAALRKKNNPVGWMLLIALIGLICLGTNTLDSYYVAHFFWLFLGVIDTRDRVAGSTGGLRTTPGEVGSL